MKHSLRGCQIGEFLLYHLFVRSWSARARDEALGNFRPRHFLKYSACYSASLEIEPNVSFSSDLTELKCEGIVLDIIDGLTGLPDQESTRYPRNGDPLILPTSQTNVSSNASSVQQREKKTSMNVIDTETTYNIAKSIMRCLVLNREDHYLNRVAPVGIFMQEFLASTIEANNSNSELHSCFFGWLQANKSFHIHGLNLESLLSAHIGPEETSDAMIPGRHDRQTFISRFHDTIVKMARRLVVSKRGLLGGWSLRRGAVTVDPTVPPRPQLVLRSSQLQQAERHHRDRQRRRPGSPARPTGAR